MENHLQGAKPNQVFARKSAPPPPPVEPELGGSSQGKRRSEAGSPASAKKIKSRPCLQPGQVDNPRELDRIMAIIRTRNGWPKTLPSLQETRLLQQNQLMPQKLAAA